MNGGEEAKEEKKVFDKGKCYTCNEKDAERADDAVAPCSNTKTCPTLLA